MKLLATLKSASLAASVLALAPMLAHAQEAAATEEAAEAAPDLASLAAGIAANAETTTFVFNTLLFLLGGILVFWMAAGFAMLEAGFVRSKNVTMQLTKNVALFAIAAVLYWLIGYNLMYPGDDGWTITGILGGWGLAGLEPVGVDAAGADDVTYASTGSDFFYQLMFCATTASIVSGALAERIKLNAFLVFTVVLAALIYPIQASWHWGGGFVSELGFSDFAGSTIVHSVGGWAALTGAIILGARIGKYKDGRVHPIPGSNLALATLGTFILWMGWFGFNGASQLAMGTIGDVADISRVMANTNAAAASGAVAALILSTLLFKKADLTLILNGALGGLVAITAEPLTPTLGWASAIGAIGGIIVVFAVPFLDKLKIDDVVGAIPVHLGAGIWGTLAVPLTNEGTSFLSQLYGIVIIGGFVIVTTSIAWLVIKAVMGIRVDQEAEIVGLDKAELGMEAYPDFTRG